MGLVKKKVKVERRCSNLGVSPKIQRPKPTLSVVARLRTSDEQHRFRAATDALLVELVRRQLGRGS